MYYLRSSPQFDAKLEVVQTEDMPLKLIHCTVHKWSPSVKRELRRVLGEVLEMFAPMPLFSVGATGTKDPHQDMLLNKFIINLGGKFLGIVNTGLGEAPLYLWEKSHGIS